MIISCQDVFVPGLWICRSREMMPSAAAIWTWKTRPFLLSSAPKTTVQDHAKMRGPLMTTRREHDLLGDRDVPADAYYGVHTLRAAGELPDLR